MTTPQLDKLTRTQELVDLENLYGTNNYRPLTSSSSALKEYGSTTLKASVTWIVWLRIRL